MALATATEYKTSRGISGSGFDTRIGVAIAAAETLIREHCGRDRAAGFDSATWTEYLDGTGTDTLRLREWPVASITSVKYRTSSTAFGTTLDSTAYYIDPVTDNTGELYRTNVSTSWDDPPGYWPSGRRNIQVVYVGGYGTIPADLKEAVYVLVDAWYAASLRDNLNTTADVLGVLNRTLKTEAERAATLHRLLSPWKRALIA